MRFQISEFSVAAAAGRIEREVTAADPDAGEVGYG